MFTLGSFVRVKGVKAGFEKDTIPHHLLNTVMKERIKADRRYAPRVKKDGKAND